MPTDYSATIEGPSLTSGLPASEPPHDLADEFTNHQEDMLNVAMGMNSLRSLQDLDASTAMNRLTREYGDGNMELWRKNWGLKAPTAGEEEVGHTVRVGSPDTHNHWHMPPVVSQPAPATPTPTAKPTPTAPAPTPTAPAPTPTAPANPPSVAAVPSTFRRILPWIVAGTLGAGGLAAGALLANNQPWIDNDTRSTLRPYTGEQ